MFLYHTTDIDRVRDILRDGALKSSALTGLAEEGQGAGLYDSNEFVYMSASESCFDPDVRWCSATIYIHAAALRGRAFHVSTGQTPRPDHPFERTEARKITRPAMPLYSRSYPSSFRSADRDDVLRELCRQSAYRSNLLRPCITQMFNQVAVKNRLDIRGRVAGISIQTGRGRFEFGDIVAFLREHHGDIPVYLCGR